MKLLASEGWIVAYKNSDASFYKGSTIQGLLERGVPSPHRLSREAKLRLWGKSMKLFQGFNFNRLWKKQLVVALVIFGLVTVVAFFATPAFGAITVESVAYNSLLYLNGDFSSAGSSAASDLKGGANQIAVLGVSFKNTVQSDLAVKVVVDAQLQEEAAVIAEVVGKPLFYPNPARQAESPKLSYVLSKNMDVEIRVYDMLANMILKTQFSAGSQGGKSGVNWLAFSDKAFDYYQLSAGVYFVLIMHEGKVMGKGKVAIIP